jgi:hypothetical protein
MTANAGVRPKPVDYRHAIDHVEDRVYLWALTHFPGPC